MKYLLFFVASAIVGGISVFCFFSYVRNASIKEFKKRVMENREYMAARLHND